MYQKDAVIEKLAPDPPVGWDTGKSPIFIVGKYFVNSTQLRCRVGDFVVRGTFITSKLVFCASPMHPTREVEHGQHRHGVLRNSNPQNMGHSTAGRSREPAGWGSAGHVYVELTNNAFDYTSAFKLFNYSGPCPTGHYCPVGESTGIYPCPRGTFVLEKGIQILPYAQRGRISRKKLNLIARAAPLGMLVLIRACMFQDYALQDLSVKSLVSLSLISPALRVIFVLKALQPLQLHVVAQDHPASYFRR